MECSPFSNKILEQTTSINVQFHVVSILSDSVENTIVVVKFDMGVMVQNKVAHFLWLTVYFIHIGYRMCANKVVSILSLSSISLMLRLFIGVIVDDY